MALEITETLSEKVVRYLDAEGKKKGWLKDYMGFSYQTLQNKLDGKTEWTKSETMVLEQLMASK